jgi:large subunit ribosomal protein L23
MKKHAGDILISPRITEKGAYLAEQSCYVFNVSARANKGEIAAAVKEIFKVTPRKVTVINTQRKLKVTRGTNRKGQTTGSKKAYVYLQKGQTIELV